MQAAGLSKLALPSQSSAALFAARVRIVRSETPGWRILYWSPASLGGTTGCDFLRERQFSRPTRSRSRFRNKVHPGLHHRAILNCAANGAALLLDDALFSGINLDRPAACCVSTGSH